MSLFKGAGVALITPFNEDNSVNYEMLRTLVKRQIDGGTDAIIVCGTTGEPATMTEEEKLSVIKCVVDETAGQIPVIAGTGSNCTQNVIDFSQKVEKLGVDGLLVVTPYYNKATQNGLYAHYAAIAGAVGLPIIMYNVPSRTGCNILPQTAARLGRNFENIVGIKEASGNISQVAKLKKLAGNDLDIYSGNDDQVIPILSLGGIGFTSQNSAYFHASAQSIPWQSPFPDQFPDKHYGHLFFPVRTDQKYDSGTPDSSLYLYQKSSICMYRFHHVHLQPPLP